METRTRCIVGTSLTREVLERIVQIERESFAAPWDLLETSKVILSRGVSCRVVEVQCMCPFRWMIVGFLIFRTDREKLVVLDVAIDPLYRRKGMGTILLNDLKDRSRRRGEKRLEVVVSEFNVDGLYFFRAAGFEADKILWEYCKEESGKVHDGYRMRWKPEKYVPKNRIAFHAPQS